jgi:CRP-like cAMP-binding protein
MAVSSQAALHSALAGVPLFAGLPAADLLELSQKLTPQRFARDEVILLQGDSHGDLHIVEGGSVRVVLTSPDGREVVLALLGPGEFFGELSLLDGLPGSAEVIAQEDCSRLTQEALASMIGSSRISINKHLKHWERQGLIRSRNGVIKVLDLEKLWQENNLGEYPLDVSQWVS